VWKKGERVVTRGGPRNKQCAWSESGRDVGFENFEKTR